MKKLLLILLLASSFPSCSYMMEIDLPKFTPKIVLNSFISPEENINIIFNWSYSATEKDHNTTAINGTATLYEEGKEIATENIEATIEDVVQGESSSFVNFNYRPKEGLHYKVVAYIDSYGEVSAQTYIPKSCEFSSKVIKQEKIEDHNYMPTAGIHFSVSDITSHDNSRSLWFVTFGRTISIKTQEEDERVTNFGILFCNNPYIDNLNRVREVDLAGELLYLEYRTGDPMYYSSLRLPQSDIDKCNSFNIASEYVYEYYEYIDENNSQVSDYLTHVRLIAVTPSDDFDRYQKSAFQQANGIYYIDMTPISFDEVRVYTNVKNGLGIFAGYSQTIVDMPVKNFSEEEE